MLSLFTVGRTIQQTSLHEKHYGRASRNLQPKHLSYLILRARIPDTALPLFCSKDGLNVLLAVFSQDHVPSSNVERLSCLCRPSATLTMHQGQVWQLCSYCSFWTAGSCVSRATIPPPLLVLLHPKAILVVHSPVCPPKLEEGLREYFYTIK